MKTKPKKSFFIKLGDEVRDKIQVSAQKKGEDHKGKSFNKYTAKYKKRKSAGKAVPKGQAVASKSIKPDLTLTGTMWRNMSKDSGEDFAEVGWTARNQAEKVQGLADGGRVIFSDDSVHPDVDKLIEKMFKDEVDSNAKTTKPTDQTIRIG